MISSFWIFKSIGEKDEHAKICLSSDPEGKAVGFFPKPVENLKLIEEWPNLSVVTDMLIEDMIGDGNPQIYTLCAAGHRSSLRVLKHGLDVNEVAKSQLPKKPLSVWTLKGKQSDEFDKHIILSFQKTTMVLLIGETVVEAKDTNLETKKCTLMVTLMQDDSIAQVFPTGIRHIKPNGAFSEWTYEHGKITNAACNQRQLALSVQGGELLYFELDSDGLLSEKEKSKNDSEILCMSIGDVPKDRQRTKFLACGFTDNTVRLFSLDVGTCLLKLSHQSLPSAPESICLIEYDEPASKFDDSLANGQLFLHVGLSNGALFKTSVEKLTGSLTETRTRFLGTDPVKLFRVVVGGRNTMLALSSRPWISYLHKDSFMVTPLIYKSLDYVWGFHSKISPEGVVGIKDNFLKIFKIERLGEIFSQTTVPLRYLPRKIVYHQRTQSMIIMEGMHRAYSESENERHLARLREIYPNDAHFSNNYKLVAPEGTWASCVRIVSPFTLSTTDMHELKNNETAISMSIVNFDQYKDDTDTFLLLGTIKDYVMMPKSFSNCYVHTFLLDANGKKMRLIHTTTMDGIPYSLAPHKGKLLAGIGYMLRMYDMGKKQLLKKCEYKHLYMGVNNIFTFGERIFATDLSDSFHLLKHKAKENQFVEIADDVLPRWITSAAVLDYHTLVGADKFQNLFVCRLPESVDEEVNEDFFTYKFKWEAGYLNGASCKFEQICNFFYGEVVTSLHKVALTSTSSETIFFATTNGSLGVLFPFETKEEVDFFIHLEMNMRMENQTLSGRDHMAYRSYHGAVKNVVDGDFCEQYITMDTAKQSLLAEEVDRKPVEVIKKLEDIRNRIL